MTLPKIRFSWRPVTVEGAKWRLGVFCFYDVRAKSAGRIRAWRLLISLRGILAWVPVFLVIAYFTGAGVLWRWLERHPYNQVTYADLVWPPRWSDLKKKRGQTMIAEGLEDFKNHKWREGEMALRIGLVRAPGETAARLKLAGFYLAINQRTRAKAVLSDGLAYAYAGSHYFGQVCALAADGEDYAWWIASCDTVLAQLAGKPELSVERRDAISQKMSAFMAANRLEDVLRFVDAQGDNHTAMLDEFKVLALLKTGKPVEAVAFLDDWRRREGATAQVIRLQVRAFREAGRIDDMDRSIAELCNYSPAEPQPYIYGIVQNLLAGRRAEADRRVDDFLLRFGSSDAVLNAFVDPLAEIDDEPLLERFIGYARQQGFNKEPLQRALAKVRIDKADWNGADKLLTEVNFGGTALPPNLEFWYGLMERLCDAAIDPADGAQSLLIDYVHNRRLPLKIDRQLIDGLRRAGRPQTARDLITIAQGIYPENDTLNTWRDELDKELTALAAARPAVVLPKKPAVVRVSEPAAPARAALKEEDFFAGLAESKKARDFAGALRQIHNARDAQPDWLSAREDEIESEEILLTGKIGDLPAMHLAADFYINGDAKHSLKAAELARVLYVAGCKEAAILLARDILKKVPDYPTAKRLLAEWEPKTTVAHP